MVVGWRSMTSRTKDGHRNHWSPAQKSTIGTKWTRLLDFCTAIFSSSLTPQPISGRGPFNDIPLVGTLSARVNCFAGSIPPWSSLTLWARKYAWENTSSHSHGNHLTGAYPQVDLDNSPPPPMAGSMNENQLKDAQLKRGNLQILVINLEPACCR